MSASNRSVRPSVAAPPDDASGRSPECGVPRPRTGRSCPVRAGTATSPAPRSPALASPNGLFGEGDAVLSGAGLVCRV